MNLAELPGKEIDGNFFWRKPNNPAAGNPTPAFPLEIAGQA